MIKFKKQYDINYDIALLVRRLADTAELRKTLKTEGWHLVVEAFHEVIQRFLQEVYDKCDNPKRNEIEIRCKKMVADSLGGILSALDKRVQSEGFLKEQLERKVSVKREAEKGIFNG